MAENDPQNTGSRENELSEALEEYIKPKRFGSKFWVKFTVIASIIFFAYLFKTGVLDDRMEPDILLSSIEIFDISSHWIVKEKVDEPDFKGIVLVPEISFRIRNVGQKELRYVMVIGVFRLLNTTKPMGEGFQMLFNEPFNPGKESDRIVLTSPFGYRATSKEAFDQNSRNWRSSSVDVYVKSRNSGMLLFKTFYINRRIEGLNLEVKII